jgi:aminoglycoside phosphotransferase (APT) family kinase protein
MPVDYRMSFTTTMLINDQVEMTKGKLIGHGRTAEVFAWGDHHALKLYYPGWPASEAEAEAQKAKTVYASGAAAPAVYGTIEVEGRYGVIYERLDGPSLINRTTSQFWTVFHSARLQAELHADMHAREVTGLPAQRMSLERKIQAARPLPEALKRVALDTLSKLPTDSVLCHGDFHPDNIILSTRGPVVLDWTDASCGHALADVARTSMIMTMAAVPVDMPGRHLIQLGRALWHFLYMRRYCELRRVSIAQINAWKLPVMAARLSEGIPEEEAPLLKALDRLFNEIEHHS